MEDDHQFMNPKYSKTCLLMSSAKDLAPLTESQAVDNNK